MREDSKPIYPGREVRHSLEFQARDAVHLAQFLAEVVRQGITYEITTLCGGGWRVWLTGGY
jgi:hypothetical protein